jgi:ketosteroid isomerase-like protein
MALTHQDRIDINDLINRHGHLVDAGQLDRLNELFTPDVTYDLGDFGLGTLVGVAAVREAADGAAGPVGHHVTNIVITEIDDSSAGVRSKGIGVNADGTAGSVVYRDTVTRGLDGWKISHRKVIAQRKAGPRKVLERFRRAAVDQSVDALRQLYAVDAIHEFPFTQPGLPSRLEGVEEIVRWTTEVWQAKAFRYGAYRTIAIHDTGDPATIVVEQEALGSSPAAGEFALPNIVVLTVHDGRITHLRDYVNILAAMDALGRSGGVVEHETEGVSKT